MSAQQRDSRPLAEELRSLIDAFLLARKAEGYSPRTQEASRASLVRLAAWLSSERKDVCSLVEVGPRVLEDYTLWLSVHETRTGKPLSIASRVNDICIQRTFFCWLTRRGRLLTDPSCDMPMPRLPPRTPRHILTVKEIERMLAVPDVSRPQGMRDRAIIELFYATGLRNFELGQLRLEDLNLGEGLITVQRGKGGRGRVLPLTELAQEAIERYLREGRPRLRGAEFDPHVFLSQRGGGLTRDGLIRIVRQVARSAKLKKPVTCHSLRHTFATHLLRGHADIRHIQELLGHKNLSSTQVYTHVAAVDLKEVLKRCHPRERKRR